MEAKIQKMTVELK